MAAAVERAAYQVAGERLAKRTGLHVAVAERCAFENHGSYHAALTSFVQSARLLGDDCFADHSVLHKNAAAINQELVAIYSAVQLVEKYGKVAETKAWEALAFSGGDWSAPAAIERLTGFDAPSEAHQLPAFIRPQAGNAYAMPVNKPAPSNDAAVPETTPQPVYRVAVDVAVGDGDASQPNDGGKAKTAAPAATGGAVGTAATQASKQPAKTAPAAAASSKKADYTAPKKQQHSAPKQPAHPAAAERNTKAKQPPSSTSTTAAGGEKAKLPSPSDAPTSAKPTAAADLGATKDTPAVLPNPSTTTAGSSESTPATQAAAGPSAQQQGDTTANGQGVAPVGPKAFPATNTALGSTAAPGQAGQPAASAFTKTKLSAPAPQKNPGPFKSAFGAIAAGTSAQNAFGKAAAPAPGFKSAFGAKAPASATGPGLAEATHEDKRADEDRAAAQHEQQRAEHQRAIAHGHLASANSHEAAAHEHELEAKIASTQFDVADADDRRKDDDKQEEEGEEVEEGDAADEAGDGDDDDDDDNERVVDDSQGQSELITPPIGSAFAKAASAAPGAGGAGSAFSSKQPGKAVYAAPAQSAATPAAPASQGPAFSQSEGWGKSGTTVGKSFASAFPKP